jgi:hypothetical protein
MSHVRQQIRAATVTALSSIGSVFASRTIPLESPELPAVLVYTNNETIERATMGTYARTLELVTEVVAQGRTFDDDLDAVLVQIETALNQSKLGGLCKPLLAASIDVTVDTSGSTPTGRARLTYQAVYYTDHSSPETAV